MSSPRQKKHKSLSAESIRSLLDEIAGAPTTESSVANEIRIALLNGPTEMQAAYEKYGGLVKTKARKPRQPLVPPELHGHAHYHEFAALLKQLKSDTAGLKKPDGSESDVELTEAVKLLLQRISVSFQRIVAPCSKDALGRLKRHVSRFSSIPVKTISRFIFPLSDVAKPPPTTTATTATTTATTATTATSEQ